MEIDEIIIKDSPGLCRCCLSDGCYKDLGSEYTWMNEIEIYADMLLECFDISISQHNDGPNGPNRLICEVCITRLRDACNFKKQVLQCEKRFIDMVGRGEFRSKVVMYQNDVKTELSTESLGNDVQAEFLTEDMDYVHDDLLNDEESVSTEIIESKNIATSSLPVKSKRGRPRKNPDISVKQKAPRMVNTSNEKKMRTNTTGEPKHKQKTVKVKVMDKSSDSQRGSGDEDIEVTKIEPRKTVSPKEKRTIIRNNVVQVLINSTVMPFRWLKSSYRCFYCYDIFQEASELKNHQTTHPGDDIKEQVMRNYWEPIVYVDISNISCKLCPELQGDLYELIDHLITKHDVVYNKDVGVCMVAFKLDNFAINCLACGASFYTFGPLLHHTNKDHKGTSAILCDICGQHFKDRNLLRLHVKTIHENTGLLCPECGEKFETRSKLKTHQKNQHDLNKRYKCLLCPQFFQSNYKRSRHMGVEHNSRQEIKCLHCPKTFVFRSMMMTHLRDTHLKVRNHTCSVCGWKAFNSNRLKNHMYKHSGEKNFKCDSCDKAFTTKKIMRAHFTRIHKNTSQSLMPYENPYISRE